MHLPALNRQLHRGDEVRPISILAVLPPPWDVQQVGIPGVLRAVSLLVKQGVPASMARVVHEKAVLSSRENR